MIPLPIMNGLLIETYLSWISSAVIEGGTQSTPKDGAIGGSFESSARWYLCTSRTEGAMQGAREGGRGAGDKRGFHH